MKTVEKHEKYLGLATVAGRSKKELFSTIKERVRKKLSGWKERNMSAAAREILIKSVAQAQLTYVMSVFRVPEGIIDEVHSMIMRFWWGQKGTEKRIPWLAREKLVCPKAEGGIGFRDLRGFNNALLARQLWNLHQRPGSLIARMMKAKYYKNGTALEANVGYRPSFVWRSLMSAQEFLCSGLRWRIGNGDLVRIWGDRWLPDVPGFFVQSPPMGLPVDSKVSELIDANTEQWDAVLIESCFPTAMAESILRIPVRGISDPDRLIWASSKTGSYEVREGYRVWLKEFMSDRGLQPIGEANMWKTIWSMKTPPKVRHFMWRFARVSLATGDQVSMRSERRGDDCPFCNLRETQVHLFGECSWVCRIWRASTLAKWFEMRDDKGCLEWVARVAQTATAEEFADWSVLLWFLWKERNAHLFNGAKLAEEEIVVRAQAYLDDYRQYQETLENSPGPVMAKTWQRPATGKIKVNVDAGVVDGGLGLGVVIRDDRGRFVLAAAKKVRYGGDPEMGEALAGEFGLLLVRQHHLGSPVLETDCLTLVGKLSTAREVHTEVGVICRSICKLMEEIGGGEWRHVSRMANEAAHKMAHVNTRWNEAEVWFDRPPMCLLDQLKLDDVTVSSD
ncbi:unnamed protein product [Linum trigynum]|uniref:Reverse transcriptase n=1 Tax=Linum trigynum TaxID=586398 RepID=A0AAV2D5V1_9ROSI